MAYALVSLVVLVLGLVVVVVSLRRDVRALGDRLDRLGPAVPADAAGAAATADGPRAAVRTVDGVGSGELQVDPQPVMITDLGRAAAEPVVVRRVSLSTPLIKVAALSYGMRRAFGEDTRTLAAVTMRRELKRQRRRRRRARKHAPQRPHPAQTHGWIS